MNSSLFKFAVVATKSLEPFGHQVAQTCRQHLEDLEHNSSFEFDERLALEAIQYIESDLQYSRGIKRYYKQKPVLLSWQRFVVAMYFGWHVSGNQTVSRYSQIELSMGRKNGVTQLRVWLHRASAFMLERRFFSESGSANHVLSLDFRASSDAALMQQVRAANPSIGVALKREFLIHQLERTPSAHFRVKHLNQIG